MYIKPPSTAPYSVRQLRIDNPDTSFPENPSDDLLAQWGVYPVEVQPDPDHDRMTQKVVRLEPVQDGDEWVQGWAVTKLDDGEIASRKLEMQQLIAARRYEVETGGITLQGMAINTEDRSKTLIDGAALASMLDPEYKLRWKTEAGYVDLSAQQVIGIAQAVRAHVQACFDREEQLLDMLEAGKLTDEVLADFWGSE